MNTQSILIKLNWQEAWRHKSFRENFVWGLTALAVLVVFTYYFFDYIERRDGGVIMNDWVLKMLPAIDCSKPIVFLEASVIIMFAIRAFANPYIFITFIIAYVFVLISRNITIAITQLAPPSGIIELKDPIAGIIYKTKLINRDLFYSGHVSLLYLFYLCSFRKTERFYILFVAVTVSILLLIQHVHYAVDVVCAPFFAFGCYWLSKK